jgi:hypothetical protein
MSTTSLASSEDFHHGFTSMVPFPSQVNLLQPPFSATCISFCRSLVVLTVAYRSIYIVLDSFPAYTTRPRLLSFLYSFFVFGLKERKFRAHSTYKLIPA